MKCKLIKVSGGIVAVKTEDTITLGEPMQPDKRYMIMSFRSRGRKDPYVRGTTDLNALEKANLVSHIYEILASTIEGIGMELVLQGLTFDENQDMLKMVGRECLYHIESNKLIIHHGRK